MKKVFGIVAMLAVGLMLSASAVSAHVPIEGIESGTLFQWPAGQEPMLDGALSEWDIVPDDYYVPFDSHFEYYLGLGLENDESNLSFRTVAGWSAGTNRLYFMMERFDNFWDRKGVGAATGTSASDHTDTTYTWNGSAWTTKTAHPVARYRPHGGAEGL